MYAVVDYSLLFFFFKQKTAYEMRISDWSSDVCSSDLLPSEGRASLDGRARYRGVVAVEDQARAADVPQRCGQGVGRNLPRRNRVRRETARRSRLARLRSRA